MNAEGGHACENERERILWTPGASAMHVESMKNWVVVSSAQGEEVKSYSHPNPGSHALREKRRDPPCKKTSTPGGRRRLHRRQRPLCPLLSPTHFLRATRPPPEARARAGLLLLARPLS